MPVFQQLYYLTHIDNVPSILRHGILSHSRIEADGIPYKPIYDLSIVQRRSERCTPDGKRLWDYVNLFFQPRNGMLYRVVPIEKQPVVVLAIRPDVVNTEGIFITTKNAATFEPPDFLPRSKGVKQIPKILKTADVDWWKSEDGSNDAVMAECLVPDHVNPEYIKTIYVANKDRAMDIQNELRQIADIKVVLDPHMFFQPSKKIDLTWNLSLVNGDMFLSRMQTLTISVNTVGVMGGGLASTAKYRFPSVYVKYQDLCRNHTLRMGKPVLVKRRVSLDYELADEPATLQGDINGETWFLLFPTKRHWREAAHRYGIEQGLEWLRQNCKKEGIQSLALPALGCGLGRLAWQQIGPLICKSLASLGIPIWLYLPAEYSVPDNQLTSEFLLG